MIYEESPVIYVERTELTDEFATWKVLTIKVFGFRVDLMRKKKEPHAIIRTRAENEEALRRYLEKEAARKRFNDVCDGSCDETVEERPLS